MDLSPYLDSLRTGLTASAAPGGPDVVRAAQLLSASVDATARLCLLDALSDAAAEITSKLDSTVVDVRIRGREAELVVTQAPAMPAPSPAPPTLDPGDVARITFRVPEALKAAVEQAATAEGLSANAWLVRIVAAAVQRPPGHSGAFGGPFDPPPHPGPPHRGRRVTGYAQA